MSFELHSLKGALSFAAITFLFSGAGVLFAQSLDTGILGTITDPGGGVELAGVAFIAPDVLPHRHADARIAGGSARAASAPAASASR